MKKLLIFPLVFLVLTGCEDKINEPETSIVTRPAICAPENPETQPSKFTFKGIQSVTGIQKTSANINWEPVQGFVAYHIIQITPATRKVLETVTDSSLNTFKLKGLMPNSEYTLMIRALDSSGFLETNTKTVSFKTLPWPNYANLKSLRFNGQQSINLGASKNFKLGKNFTLSLWAKTNQKQDEDGRLITFHYGSKAGSWLSLGLSKEALEVHYRNEDDENRQFRHNFNYYSEVWHNYNITYDGQFLVVSIDGNQAFRLKDVLKPMLGRHPARIGSYTGTQRGFSGNIDEVAIFNKTFTPDETSELFNQGQSMDLKNHSQGSALIHWYQMGDAGSDDAGNIEDIIGKLNGAPLNIRDSDFSHDSP